MRLAAVLAKGLGLTRQSEGSDIEPTYPDFHAALLTMAQRSASRSGRGAPDARMFGKWLQRFNTRRERVMSDELDWNFSDKDDAKAEIRAAVEYLLRDVTGGTRGDIVQEIIAIVRQVANGLPSDQPDPLDDGLPGG